MILDRLAPRPTLLFTVTEYRSDYTEVNDVVRRLGSEYDNVTIIDWQAIAETPGVLSSDRLHPTETGSRGARPGGGRCAGPGFDRRRSVLEVGVPRRLGGQPRHRRRLERRWLDAPPPGATTTTTVRPSSTTTTSVAGSGSVAPPPRPRRRRRTPHDDAASTTPTTATTAAADDDARLPPTTRHDGPADDGDHRRRRQPRSIRRGSARSTDRPADPTTHL